MNLFLLALSCGVIGGALSAGQGGLLDGLTGGGGGGALSGLSGLTGGGGLSGLTGGGLSGLTGRGNPLSGLTGGGNGRGIFGGARRSNSRRDSRSSWEYPWSRNGGGFGDNEMCEEHVENIRCRRQDRRDKDFCEEMLFNMYYVISSGFTRTRAVPQGFGAAGAGSNRKGFWTNSGPSARGPSAVGGGGGGAPSFAGWRGGTSRNRPSNNRLSPEDKLRYQVCNFLYYYRGAKELCCEQLTMLCEDFEDGGVGSRRRERTDEDSRDRCDWTYESGRRGRSGTWECV